MATDNDTETDRARAVAERYCRAWAGGDLVAIVECYSSDFTLRYFGDNPFSGDHAGRDRAIETLLAVGALAPRRLVVVEDVLAGPGTAVVVAIEAIEVDGIEHQIRRVLRYRVVDDLFAECWLYEENQALIDRAWSAGRAAG